jgi:hypothetical protein
MNRKQREGAPSKELLLKRKIFLVKSEIQMTTELLLLLKSGQNRNFHLHSHLRFVISQGKDRQTISRLTL